MADTRIRVLFCESCGAPVHAPWDRLAVACSFCKAQNIPGDPRDPVLQRAPVDSRPRLAIAGRTYVLEGLLAQGDSASVYRGRWVVRLGELVILKILRALSDADLLENEWRILGRLYEQAPPAIRDRLPEPIAIGALRDGTALPVYLYGWKSGYHLTLAQVMASHPRGVDGEVVVWVTKRLLEILSYAHQVGIVHGAPIPPHVLVHPRDHGAMLVGWSVAGAPSEQRAPRSSGFEAYYPQGSLGRRTSSMASDVAMVARCGLAAAGGGVSKPPRYDFPPRLRSLLEKAAAGKWAKAWELRDAISEASLAVYGAPTYHPLAMPGWSGRVNKGERRWGTAHTATPPTRP